MIALATRHVNLKKNSFKYPKHQLTLRNLIQRCQTAINALWESPLASSCSCPELLWKAAAVGFLCGTCFHKPSSPTSPR